MKSVREIENGFVNVEEKLNSANKIIIFGASSGGKKLKTYFNTNMGLNVDYFVDNDPKKWNATIEGVTVLSPSCLLALYNKATDTVICIASDWAKDIAYQLQEMNIKNYMDLTHWTERRDCFDCKKHKTHLADIEELYYLLADNESKEVFLSVLEYRKSLDPICLEVSEFDQYCHSSMHFEVCKILFDGGAWIGDTTIKFAKLMSKCSKIVAFEPTPDSLTALCHNVRKEGLERIVIPAAIGLGDRSGYDWIQFHLASSSNRIASSGSVLVRVTTIDDFVNEVEMIPDLIKMDIEGSELAALHGARNTISKYHPGLQVCVYHHCEDLWEIPLFIKELQPDYTFYLGHHSLSLRETVLYAVML